MGDLGARSQFEERRGQDRAFFAALFDAVDSLPRGRWLLSHRR
jgi:hypothetical protein